MLFFYKHRIHNTEVFAQLSCILILHSLYYVWFKIVIDQALSIEDHSKLEFSLRYFDSSLRDFPPCSRPDIFIGCM